MFSIVFSRFYTFRFIIMGFFESIPPYYLSFFSSDETLTNESSSSFSFFFLFLLLNHLGEASSNIITFIQYTNTSNRILNLKKFALSSGLVSPYLILEEERIIRGRSFRSGAKNRFKLFLNVGQKGKKKVFSRQDISTREPDERGEGWDIRVTFFFFFF